MFRQPAGLHDLQVHDEDEAVVIRLGRRRHLYDPSKRFEFLLTEPVLRWRACPPQVLRWAAGDLADVRAAAQRTTGHAAAGPLDQHNSAERFQIYDSTTVVEIFSGEIIFAPRSTAHYGRVLDQLWPDAVTGPDLDQVLADAIARLR